jgi:hypothetical protein
MTEMIFISAPHGHSRGSTSKIFRANTTSLSYTSPAPLIANATLLECGRTQQMRHHVLTNHQLQYYLQLASDNPDRPPTGQQRHRHSNRSKALMGRKRRGILVRRLSRENEQSNLLGH